jgi:integrase
MEARESSFNVRVWKVDKRPRASGTSYRLRWAVADKRHTRTFATAALADSERAALLSAARRGEAFDVETGLPLARVPDDRNTTWWEWSQQFVDAKWPDLAPRSRRSVAEALMAPTLVLTASGLRGEPTAKELRSAMFGWAFNTPVREAGPPSDELLPAVRWLEEHSLRLVLLEDPLVTRQVLEAISRTLDGTTAAPTTVARKRAVLHNALEMAVEHGLLSANPLDRVRWRAPRISEAVDPRTMVNPKQAKALIEALRTVPGGKRYMAFFGSMYYSALRPSEAAALDVSALDLPPEGWGWLLLSRSNAEVSGTWTNGGERTARQLKHRAQGEVRKVPCPPALTALIHDHVAAFGVSDSGRLFRGPYGGQVASQAYNRAWRKARKAALTPAEVESPLAHRAYDLRHSAVSTWLAAGVDSAQVAAWAGHSVAVLHRVYAHVLSGRDDHARLRIENLLDEQTD